MAAHVIIILIIFCVTDASEKCQLYSLSIIIQKSVGIIDYYNLVDILFQFSFSHSWSRRGCNAEQNASARTS